jgi:PPP family 3-phenylpropionic acid transporter
MYGRVRLGGTLGWGITALVIGTLIQAYGLRVAFWGYAALMSLALIVSQGFSFGKSSGSVSLRSGARTLLSNRRWMIFLGMAFACGIGFTSINNYLLPYMKELGANETMMGVALSIATLAELPVLYFSSHLIKRLKTRGMLALSMIFTVARLLLYAATASPVGVLIVQLINGLTFPIFWVAGVSYADEIAPTGMSATAQGLLGVVVFGFGSAVGGLIGGILLENLGGRSMYLIIGVIVSVGLAILSSIERLQSDGLQSKEG